MKNSRDGRNVINSKYFSEKHRMPNNKPKRVRHKEEDIDHCEEMVNWYDFRINILGIFGAIAIGIFCPLGLSWKASIIILLLMSSCQVIEKED